METKYDWSGVSEHITHIATDSDGWAFGYKSEPEISGNEFDGEVVFGFAIQPRNNTFKGNWRDSLEQRPVEKN